MKMTFKFLFLVTTMALAKAELFTNVAEMASVFTLEQELVKILVDFKDQIETNLKMIKDFRYQCVAVGSSSSLFMSSLIAVTMSKKSTKKKTVGLTRTSAMTMPSPPRSCPTPSTTTRS